MFTFNYVRSHMCVCVGMCASVCCCPQRLEKGSRLLEPELQEVVSHCLWVLGTNRGSPKRTCALKCRAISPAPFFAVTFCLFILPVYECVHTLRSENSLQDSFLYQVW